MSEARSDVSVMSVFDMREITPSSLDQGLREAGDALAVVFFWGVNCFNCEVAKKGMLAQPGAIRALSLRWYHGNVYEHSELGKRFGLHGIPAWLFFHRGKRLGRVTGWHGIERFRGAVEAARAKIGRGLVVCGPTGSASRP